MEQITFELVPNDDGATILNAEASPKLRAVDWAAPARNGAVAIELFSDEEYQELRSVLLAQNLPGGDIYIAWSSKVVWNREHTSFSLDHMLCLYAELDSDIVVFLDDCETGRKYLCRPETAQVLAVPDYASS